MRDTTPPRDDDPAAEDPAGDGQEVSGSRVGGSLFQIRDVRGNITIGNAPPGHRPSPTRRWTWAAAVAATSILAAGGVWILHGRPQRAPRPAPSQSPLSVTRSVTPIQRIRAVQGDQAFIFSKPAAALPSLPPGYRNDQQLVEKWGYGNGGVDADITTLELVIQGTSAKSVVLTDFRIDVLGRAAPPRATYVKVFPGGDGVDGRNATDLDEAAPMIKDLRNVSGEDTGGTWSFPLRVSQAEPEVLYLWAGASKHDCWWTAKLHFVADGKPGFVVINNKGRPFRTASSANSKRYAVEDGRVVPGGGPLGGPAD
ncbi:hypothetical protein [Actinomadura terrae]|uniref:hypothetical protein n=1 Tax=Actinomadura terrae TaxID=604353 RepID=UPI001FA73964|nr:hypothetical protein [Actinomadura terrae]